MARSDWSGYVTCGPSDHRRIDSQELFLRKHESMRFETTGSCGGTLLTNPCFSRLQKTGGRFRNLFSVSWWLTPSFVRIYRISLHSVMAGLWVKLVSRKWGWFILKATRNVGPLGHSTEFSSCMIPLLWFLRLMVHHAYVQQVNCS